MLLLLLLRRHFDNFALSFLRLLRIWASAEGLFHICENQPLVLSPFLHTQLWHWPNGPNVCHWATQELWHFFKSQKLLNKIDFLCKISQFLRYFLQESAQFLYSACSLLSVKNCGTFQNSGMDFPVPQFRLRHFPTYTRAFEHIFRIYV